MNDGGDSSSRRRPPPPEPVDAKERRAIGAGGERGGATGERGVRSALPASSAPIPTLPQHSFVADEIAGLAQTVRLATGAETRCDACDAPIDGEPAGSGLYFWTREGESRWEEPALCGSCATIIGVSALRRWEIEDDEG